MIEMSNSEYGKLFDELYARFEAGEITAEEVCAEMWKVDRNGRRNNTNIFVNNICKDGATYSPGNQLNIFYTNSNLSNNSKL